jgi:hypothetical protein
MSGGKSIYKENTPNKFLGQKYLDQISRFTTALGGKEEIRKIQ